MYKKSDSLSSSISRDVSYLRPLLSVLSTLQSHFSGDSEGGIGIQVSLFGRVGQTMSTILLPAPLGAGVLCRAVVAAKSGVCLDNAA